MLFRENTKNIIGIDIKDEITVGKKGHVCMTLRNIYTEAETVLLSNLLVRNSIKSRCTA